MNNNLQISNALLAKTMILFWAFFSLIIYVRKGLKSFLYFSIALFVHFLLSVFIIKYGYDYSMISFVVLMLVALIASSKELIEADREGLSAWQWLNIDNFDILLGIFLYIVWLIVRSFL